MSIFIDWTWGDINNGDVGPGMFSWFHLLWLAIMIISSVIMAKTVAKKHSPKYDQIVVLIFSIILIICEVFKQLFWFEFYGYYRFEIFPFQFCTVPIYVSTFASIIKSEKIKEVCYRFLAFYGIIGGLAVMLIPTAVLYTYFVAMSIHSMLWHSILVIMGVYLVASRGYGKNIIELFIPSLMLLGFVILAIIGTIRNASKSEYENIEHGSSDWSKNGEQYKILNRSRGIILAEDNYLPLDKRGNTNVLVVGRFWFW